MYLRLLFLLTPITPPIKAESKIIIKRKSVLILKLELFAIRDISNKIKKTAIPMQKPIKSPLLPIFLARSIADKKVPIAAEIVANSGENSYPPSIKYITAAKINILIAVTESQRKNIFKIKI